MKSKLEEERQYFFENYQKEEPWKVLLFMILSLGFYFLMWIYNNNKRLEMISEDAPNSRRGFIILFGFPILWYVISSLAKLVFFDLDTEFIFFVNLTGWILIALLSLKYLYDFCKMFGEVTETYGIGWYFLIYPGYYSIILLFLNFYYTIALILCFLVTIPMMQFTLNSKSEKLKLNKNAKEFNYLTRRY